MPAGVEDLIWRGFTLRWNAVDHRYEGTRGSFRVQAYRAGELGWAGVVEDTRRDPNALRSFHGYHISDRGQALNLAAAKWAELEKLDAHVQ